VDAEQPFVIPTAFARIGERLVVHGSAASRMLKALADRALGSLGSGSVTPILYGAKFTNNAHRFSHRHIDALFGWPIVLHFRSSDNRER
jgi:hypothetical protein